MKILSFLLSFFLFCGAAAEIHEIQKMCELETFISAPLTNQDWILFDIDYTLVEPEHPVLKMGTIRKHKHRFKEELTRFPEEQQLLAPILIITQFPSQLTDPIVPALIQNLQNQGATVFGFTAADTAAVPEIGPFPLWRSEELKRLGINFSPTIFPMDTIEFAQFPSFRGTFPLYQDGILYSNIIPSKGEVLAAFLDRIAVKPARVIFVEDTLENLQSVEAEMQKRGIPFIGIHYRVHIDDEDMPKISNEEWNEVWDKIRERTERLS